MKAFVSFRRWIGGAISILVLSGLMRVSAQIPVITGDPEYAALPVGSTALFYVSVSSSTFVSVQWFRGTQQLAAANSPALILTNLTPSLQGEYFAVVSNVFGSATSAPASLVVLPIIPGMVDPMFNAGFGPDNVVRAVRPDSDGHIYIGGEFSAVNGTSRARLARLNSNGSLDGAFTAGVSNSGGFAFVYALAVQTNHQLIVGGSFSHVNGTPRQSLARINADGTLDASFDAAIPGGFSSVWAITLLIDGKILIGGDFASVLGATRNRVALLNSNGTLDSFFGSGAGMNASVRAFAVQPDGKVVVGGAFTTVNGQPRARITRLTEIGALDPTFNSSAGADSWVNALALQPDGKIILGGSFANVNGNYHPYLARLSASGLVDPVFNLTNQPNGPLTSLALQPDGKVIIGGGFTVLGTEFHQNFARLKSDGSIDDAFYATPGASSWVEAIALDASGAVLIGGAFYSVNGLVRPYVARLFGGDPAPFAPIFTSQPVRQQTLGEGDHFELSGQALAFPSPAYYWKFNGTNLPGANSPFLQRNNVRLVNAGNYQLIASNSVGSATSRVSVVTITPARVGPGTLDIDYYSGTGPNSDVRTIAVQPDGKAVIGGWFYFVDGVYQPYFARLNVDGSLDPDFSPTLDSIVTHLAISPSGAIGVAGYFSSADGVPNPGLALFNTNGALIPTFHSSILPGGVVQSFAFQSNSQVIVAGYFLASNDASTFFKTNLARLNTNGSLDATFIGGDDGNVDIATMAIDTNRKILIGGGFATIQGNARRGIARLNYYGDLDPTFNPGSGANGRVTSVVIQPDGKILIAGTFRAFNGVPRHQIARLHPNGALDLSFEPGHGASAAISALCLQSDGKILIGGGFTEVNFRSRFHIARLNHDGSLDLTFDPGGGANLEVNSIVELPGGKVLIGGAFTSYDYLPRPHIARVHAGNPPPFAPVIASQSDDQNVQAGEDVNLFVEASGLPEPTYQWQFFGTNLPGATTWTLTLHNVRSFAAGDYTVIVSNSLNSVISLPITLNVIAPSRTAGSPDISFYTGLGPNDRVNAIAVQPDRKIIIGGAFSEISGLSRNRIARLLYDGSVDPSFDPGTGANDAVFALAIQSDGKILVGGAFTNFNGLPRNRIVRLETNGAVDLSLNTGLGADNEIRAVAPHLGTEILIGGIFSQVDGQARRGLARLHANGSLDTSFLPSLVGAVYALDTHTNGVILAGGSFSGSSTGNLYNVARLHPLTGQVLPTFNSFGANGAVHTLDIDRSNRLVLGGEFFALDGVPRTRVGRLEANGSADLTFTNAGVNGLVSALVVEPDDKIVIGGQFRSIGNFPYVGLIVRNRLARMNSDGSVDLSFASGSGVQGGTSYIDEYGSISEQTTVLALAREADGKILVGGDFTTVNEIARPYIARVFGREASSAVAVHKGQGNVELIWDTGILQVANQLTGPWTDLPNAQSPLLYPTGGAQQFFRLKFN
jgi:uncharacterized delta-60 repeat protein